MTIDQVLENASAQIDAILRQRLDDMACQMIANGADPTKPPATEDADGDWQRVSFDEILERQRAIDAKWKTEVLVLIRTWVEAEYARVR
jgi:hypothetical protein